MAHAGFQVSEQPLPPPGAIPRQPGELCEHNSPRSQLREQRHGKERLGKGPCRGDGRGCMSPQHREALAGGSHGPSLHSADCSPRGWSLTALKLLQACTRRTESSFWWRASFPLPASRVCCQCCPCARQGWPLQGHQRGSMCVMCQTVCASACLHGKEAAEGGGRDDFEGGLRKQKKKKKKKNKEGNSSVL